MAIFWSTNRANAANAVAVQAEATAGASELAITQAAADALVAQLENQQLAAQSTQEALNAQATLLATERENQALIIKAPRKPRFPREPSAPRKRRPRFQAEAIGTSQAQSATRIQVEATGTNQAGRATSTAQAELALTATAVMRATEEAAPINPRPTATPSQSDLVAQFNETALLAKILREKIACPCSTSPAANFSWVLSREIPTSSRGRLSPCLIITLINLKSVCSNSPIS
ncbi:MAG: hypothetical protein M5U34_31115 [Chloroflexi bacterium]|nr:hypothetical protein [Chloroflexota bacterium]